MIEKNATNRKGYPNRIKETMANKINYQKELEKILQKNTDENRIPTLLLHSCCAPCSSYVMEYLSDYFKITVFYYNPNIYPDEEYKHRVLEQQSLISRMPLRYPVTFLEGDFEKEKFYDMARGLENIPEGGERCFRCYRLRLKKTAELAALGGFDFFCTTLSISPLKNAEKINEIGRSLAAEYHIDWLPSDFKKKNGYKRSVELSAEYGLYRQDYCGCVFSRREREQSTHSGS